MRLAAVLAVAPTFAACAPKDHDVFSNHDRVHRWTVTNEAGTVLSQGCAAWSDAPAGDLSYWATRVLVTAAPNTLLVDDDNHGTEEVQKYIVDPGPMPPKDEFWCGTQGDERRGPQPFLGLDCYEIVEPNPPATLEGFELIDPEPTDVGTQARGFRARLRVQHAGVVHLTLDPAKCWGDDAGSPWTYGVLTITTP